MPQPPQDQPYKKKPELRSSKSQGWSWPHLVSAQSKKSAAGSLHTPDEQAEVSPTAKEEDSIRQPSPTRSSRSVTPSGTGSLTPSCETAVPEDQNIQNNGSENKQETDPRKSGPDAEKDASHQHEEGAAQSRQTQEKDVQQTEDSDETSSTQERVRDTSSSCSDECMNRWLQDPCNEKNCDHAEESSHSRSDASTDEEENAAHHEEAKLVNEGREESNRKHGEDSSLSSSDDSADAEQHATYQEGAKTISDSSEQGMSHK